MECRLDGPHSAPRFKVVFNKNVDVQLDLFGTRPREEAGLGDAEQEPELACPGRKSSLRIAALVGARSRHCRVARERDRKRELSDPREGNAALLCGTGLDRGRSHERTHRPQAMRFDGTCWIQSS